MKILFPNLTEEEFIDLMLDPNTPDEMKKDLCRGREDLLNAVLMGVRQTLDNEGYSRVGRYVLDDEGRICIFNK